ncbi:toll/interleukin-1 receptor domain-containing protein [Flavobacterium sp.]|uniref:toll/interleukin-1 receptor domain-containing protein n=1 Tax=Flavobacterium sp. TaxID=239 RepID=UPI00263537D8|nr:toll/interleukin-1 receptor domain-containing protein [Flavobacterium sp.]
MEKYHAFISYSHNDKHYVSAIQKSIETLGLPFHKKWKSDVSFFIDEKKMKVSEDLSEEIKKGLRDSKYLIVIASPNSASTDSWVIKEIEYWYAIKNNSTGGISSFHLIVLDGSIKWDSQAQAFSVDSSALPNFGNIKFNAQPIWANVQNYCKDGKIQTKNPNYEWEIAKVKALLLDKSPDEIIDEVAKEKRLFRIITGFVISLLVMLSAFAFYLRGEAVSKKNLAEAKTKEALNNLKRFKLEEFERNFKNGNTYLNAEEYCFADSCFSEALKTTKNKDYRELFPKSKIKYLDSISSVCKSKSSCK